MSKLFSVSKTTDAVILWTWTVKLNHCEILEENAKLLPKITDLLKVINENRTTFTEFILLGLTNQPELQVVIFIFLLLAYMLSVLGNLTIIILTLVDPHLKTPVYFFLWNFSFLEISFTSIFIPRFLTSMTTGNKVISFASCLTQYFFAIFLGATEFYLLASMSYDRYVAICKPLHYLTIMNSRVCIQLVFCSWIAGVLTVLPSIILISQMDFCTSNVLNQYYCDCRPLVEIACSDTSLLQLIVILLAVLTLVVTVVLAILCYIYIIRTILRIPSAQQRTKAFSTCSSHMIVISLSYGSCIFLYIDLSPKKGGNFDKEVSLLMTSVSPLLNPFIYTLRNQLVKQAFKNIVKKIVKFE
ncbi:LOW QUALITY PROTEIN: olfactory receptor 6C4-like [Trichechus manatus latirostris]|uniref:Olfactory receptor n=1 Tax=Trichechus manatus latirostris TaxID=127582 RepID=A0A2Y9FZ54_TRIMA|nr:LOW QUALITY PROTEIN: olfactory receptor 6C4-like [Trichechus manatus latirostris]